MKQNRFLNPTKTHRFWCKTHEIALPQMHCDTSFSIPVFSLIECRAHLDPPLPFDAIGNYDAGLPLSAKVNESTPFWDIARSLSTSANESVSSRKMFTEMPVLDSLFSTVCISRPAKGLKCPKLAWALYISSSCIGWQRQYQNLISLLSTLGELKEGLLKNNDRKSKLWWFNDVFVYCLSTVIGASM